MHRTETRGTEIGGIFSACERENVKAARVNDSFLTKRAREPSTSPVHRGTDGGNVCRAALRACIMHIA